MSSNGWTRTINPAARDIAFILFGLTHTMGDYSDRINGIQGIAHVITDLGLDSDGLDAWFDEHRDQIKHVIADYVIDRETYYKDLHDTWE